MVEVVDALDGSVVDEVDVTESDAGTSVVEVVEGSGSVEGPDVDVVDVVDVVDAPGAVDDVEDASEASASVEAA